MMDESKTCVPLLMGIILGTTLGSLIVLPVVIDGQIEKGYIQNSNRVTFKVVKTSEYIQLLNNTNKLKELTK